MKYMALTFCGTAALFVCCISPLQADEQTDTAQSKEIVAMVKDKCISCHTQEYKLPFYAAIPGIKGMIEKDYFDAMRSLDLEKTLISLPSGTPAGEVTIAKMEWVIEHDTMPPKKYQVVHWGSRLNPVEKKEILEWVKNTRKKYYATGLAVASRANEPVQPLPSSVPTDPGKVAVGEKLFNDTRLSVDNTVSCASCHQEKKARTDNLRFSEGVGKKLGNVNAPTAYNALFYVRQFWDGRAADLQEQAGGPPLNPVEMASRDWKEIIGKLAGDSRLTAEFRAEYSDGWSEKNITHAIAEYEKTLLTPDSAFDKWLKGNDAALSDPELRGYEKFKNYRCVTCHVGKAMGGQSFEYMDLKKDYFADRGSEVLGSDIGLAGFTNNRTDLHKFKVPSLRNIELTAPYMHDGLVTTLDEAVRIMGVYVAGFDISPADRKEIVAFLRTLTGEFQGERVQGTAVAH